MEQITFGILIGMDLIIVLYTSYFSLFNNKYLLHTLAVFGILQMHRRCNYDKI